MRIGELARPIPNAGVQLVVVVDADSRPVGVVSASDIVSTVGATAPDR